MPLQAENITTLVKAAGVTVEPYWPGLFAKLFEKRSIADLITNVGAGEFKASYALLSVCRYSPTNGRPSPDALGLAAKTICVSPSQSVYK